MKLYFPFYFILMKEFKSMKIYDLKKTTVCKACENYPRHSEASVAECKNGALTMVWQRFGKSGAGSNDTAPAVIAMMDNKSGDPINGEWTGLRVAGERIPGCVNAYSPNLIRRKDGGEREHARTGCAAGKRAADWTGGCGICAPGTDRCQAWEQAPACRGDHGYNADLPAE